MDTFVAKVLPTDFPLVTPIRRYAPMNHDVLSPSLLHIRPHHLHPLALIGGVVRLDFTFSVPL